MSTRERFQNPVVGDEVNLRLFAYNSNNKRDFYEVDSVKIYFIDPNSEPPNQKILIQEVSGTSVVHTDTGEYTLTVSLTSPQYVIGQYVDEWYVRVEEGEDLATIENVWQIYPNLWFTTPLPTVYDFNFSFRPNKIRKGSIKYLIIEIRPNVPNASDLARYYENLAIVSPITITIQQTCGDCMPAESDLRMIVEDDPVDLREKCLGYYKLDTTEMNEGIYDVWFQMSFGDNIYISDKQQLQIY